MANLIEKVEKIKMSYRILIFAGSLLAIIAILIFAIYQPYQYEIKAYQTKIRALEKEIKKAKLREKKLAKFEEENAKSEENLKNALKLLPNEKEIPNLLRTITALGLDSGLEFVLFSPKKEVAQEFYYEIPVSIEVIGKYHDVAKFFDKVGGMDRIVNIHDVSMKPQGALSTTLTTNCSAVTFRFKEESKDDSKKKKKSKKGKNPKFKDKFKKKK